MNPTTDISITKLGIAILIISIPLLIFWILKIKLIKSTLIAVTRMVIQLALIASYLEYIFELNSPIVNSAWVFIMVVISGWSTVKKANYKSKYLFIPICISIFTSLIIIDLFFLGFVLKLDNIFDAKYLIPISGMILGNGIIYNTIGISEFTHQLKYNIELYQFTLITTHSKQKALRFFYQKSLTKAVTPLISSISVIGLISLPGMMTGQILGGSSPSTAIKYQIAIMIAILVASILSLFLSLLLSSLLLFDKNHNLKN